LCRFFNVLRELTIFMASLSGGEFGRTIVAEAGAVNRDGDAEHRAD
jgi:hypothetical protein